MSEQRRAADRRVSGSDRGEEGLCLVIGHRIERESDGRLRARAFEQRVQKRLGCDLFSAKAGDGQNRWRLRRPEQLLEQHGAVGVGPMQVVDAHNQRLPGRQAGQQLAQRCKARRRSMNGSAFSRSSPVCRCDRLHLQHDREKPRQRRHVGWKQRFGLRSRQAAQMVTETVDHAIERLVRHRFVLVAAAPQHDDIFAADHVLEKALDQGALADAGGP